MAALLESGMLIGHRLPAAGGFPCLTGTGGITSGVRGPVSIDTPDRTDAYRRTFRRPKVSGSDNFGQPDDEDRGASLRISEGADLKAKSLWQETPLGPMRIFWRLFLKKILDDKA